MRAVAFVLPVLIFSAVTAAGAAPKKDLVKPESLAGVSSIKPGEPFQVGVRFKIEPEWHIYWINPGESGQATTVEWAFPEGFTVGPLQYPVPVNFPQPGDVKGYGYLDEVMLMATVTPPANVAAGTEVPFSVKASWLVCSDVCIPGKATLSGKLTVASSAKPANEAVFKNWNQRLPVRDLSAVKGVVAGAAAHQPSGAAGPVQLVVKWQGPPPAKVEWFVGTPDSVMLQDVVATTERRESRCTFSPVPVPEDAVEVPVVVAYVDAAGQRRAVEFSFQLGKKSVAPKGQAAASN